MTSFVNTLATLCVAAMLSALTVGCTHVPAPSENLSKPIGVQDSKRKISEQVSRATYQTKEVLSYEDLIQFEYDCSKRSQQLILLDDQIKNRTFYKVNGVDGNDFPDRISKKYFSLVKFRIWSLRLGCKGSGVDKHTESRLKDTHLNHLPDPVARCYFEENTISTSSIGVDGNYGDKLVSRRKEFCTNYPIIADSKEIEVGDVVDPKLQLSKNIPSIPNLRKWQGNIFQIVSKTEIRNDEPVKFTIVLMWSGKGWVVVDKF